MIEERDTNPPCTQCGAAIGHEPRPLALRLLGVCSDQCNQAASNWTRIGCDLPEPDGQHLLVIGLGAFPIVCTTMGALVRIVPLWGPYQKRDSEKLSRTGEVARFGVTVRRIGIYRGERK